MGPPNSPGINPVDYAIWGALQQRVYFLSERTIQDGGITEASESPSGKNSHSVSLITVSMNGFDVLKLLLSRMAADTSSIATWLDQLHIILILLRDKCRLYHRWTASVNGDIAIQWEWSKFDPSQNQNPLTDYDKTLHN